MFCQVGILKEQSALLTAEPYFQISHTHTHRHTDQSVISLPVLAITISIYIYSQSIFTAGIQAPSGPKNATLQLRVDGVIKLYHHLLLDEDTK